LKFKLSFRFSGSAKFLSDQVQSSDLFPKLNVSNDYIYKLNLSELNETEVEPCRLHLKHQKMVIKVTSVHCSMHITSSVYWTYYFLS
jgi:hypothetical protein